MREISSRALTTYYAVALIILATLSILCHVVLARELHLGESSASLINLSGQQRVLAQRIASMAAQYRLGVPSARQDLILAIDDFEKNHQHLAEVISTRNTHDSGHKRLVELYGADQSSLDTELQNYVVIARRIADTPAKAPQLTSLLAALFAQARSPLLRDLDEVVSIHQHESEIRMNRLRHLQTFILVVVLFTLLLEAFTIFRPMVRRIVRYTAKLITLASTDPLTGVANRRSFMDSGEKELDRSRRYHRPLSLLVVDVDHFKRVNDTLGHAVGDKVLTELTATLTQGLRSVDVLGRIGGEEFAILLSETSISSAAQVAERLRASVAALRIESADQPVQITISIGVTQASGTAATISDLLIDADSALYRAKETGRNCVVLNSGNALFPDTKSLFTPTSGTSLAM